MDAGYRLVMWSRGLSSESGESGGQFRSCSRVFGNKFKCTVGPRTARAATNNCFSFPLSTLYIRTDTVVVLTRRHLETI